MISFPEKFSCRGIISAIGGDPHHRVLHDLQLAHVLLGKHRAVPFLHIHAAWQTPNAPEHCEAEHLFAIVDSINNLVEPESWKKFFQSF